MFKWVFKTLLNFLVIQLCDNTEAYLGPFHTPMNELFRENSYQLLAINYFRKIAPSQVFGRILNTSQRRLVSEIYEFHIFTTVYTRSSNFSGRKNSENLTIFNVCVCRIPWLVKTNMQIFTCSKQQQKQQKKL